MMTEATVERLSGQIKAQKILIQILLGKQVLQSTESGIGKGCVFGNPPWFGGGVRRGAVRQ
jgi:hypothetical protein